ncbi:MAG: PP2C family protein-serine/threonine phosphatase [Thermoanaerobaculum sp.]
MSVEGILALFQEASHGRQGELPQQVLAHLVAESGATAGALRRGSQVLAETGDFCGPRSVFAVPAGRETFELELSGGLPPSEGTLLAAGTVLAAWWLREELRASRFAERRRVWEGESLRAMAEVLSGQLDPRVVGQSLLFHAMALLDARRGELWLAPELCSSFGPQGDGRAPFCLVERVGREILVGRRFDALGEPTLVSPHVLVAPIRDRDRSLGILALAEREVRGGLAPFSEKDLDTVTLFAAQGALAFAAILALNLRVERERLEGELALAAAVQKHLLPRLPERWGGWEFAGFSVPSRQVGGDLYDVVEYDSKLTLSVFDVSGKGVPAALLAASLQGALRLAATRTKRLEVLARLLDQHLATLWAAHQFATAFFLEFEPGGTVRYLGAGHPPAVVVSPTRPLRLLRSQGPPLGLVEEPMLRDDVATLAVGETLVVVTDGILEAGNEGGQEFGLDRLQGLLAAHAAAPLPQLLERVRESVFAFTGAVPGGDDCTLVAVRRKS